MFFHPCRDVRQAAWDPCSYRWIIWLKREIELCVIGVAMVGEAMCPSDVVYVEKRRGPRTDPWGTPVTSWCALDTSHPRPPWRTYRWDRIQTSEVESQWCPAMRGWTGGSDDWQCQKQQKDRAEWGPMIWNRPLRLAGLQWQSSAVSVEWPLLKPDCLASSLLYCERNSESWLKTTRSSVFATNGRRETGL